MKGVSLLRSAVILLLVLALVPACAPAGAAKGEDPVCTARPSVNGRLRVEGTSLSDGSGCPVQLRGVSTHGLTWYPEYLNEGLFRQIAEEWGCELVRLAMYASIYTEDPETSYALMKQGIDAAVAADLYVLVDWHMLEHGDPNEEADDAIAFFDRITGEYASCPNLIFEICNEPNGMTDWSDVMTYAEKVIPVIRANIPEAVIVVGTPEYDKNLAAPLLRPLPYDNIMYVLHFYAATHREGLRGELRAAIGAGLPVFISECGVCEADGNGSIDLDSAVEWFRCLNENGISYAVWSLSDKDESSAFFRPGFDPGSRIREEDLTASGLWVSRLLRGEDPGQIPAPVLRSRPGLLARIGSAVSLSVDRQGRNAIRSWARFAGIAGAILLFGMLLILLYTKRRKSVSYDDIAFAEKKAEPGHRGIPKLLLILSVFCTLIYLGWRIAYSVPFGSGAIAVSGNLILLAVEILGFGESLVLFRQLLGSKRYGLPAVGEGSWPEVDVFIATYNEPTELIRRTVNGCLHMKYPDPSLVHIWICDDSRRPAMRELAERMHVGYFDRPDNQGAKAGNLNHALGLTHAPYIVTFDADMIPKSDFLLKTIPYFTDAASHRVVRGKRVRLGFLQTPQSFYDPDVFQFALYSEKRAPNEQDFFYRVIEPAKTGANAVIYGGSNTVLAREALDAVGGFYTGSVTEDFATGLLIESAGFVSLAIPEPLASGQTPHTFREHIAQRTRWGRGVVVTAKQLGIVRRRDLTCAQKLSYLSSVIYWFSPLKNLIYLLSPLLFAVFAVPVFRCSWPELVIFWLPMFLLQDLSLRLNSFHSVSTKWSGIYETSVMPFLLLPILKELLGIRIQGFRVTDKSKRAEKRTRDIRLLLPFLLLSVLSVAGIIRIALMLGSLQSIGLVVLLFWLIRNLYFLIMALFLADGRDGDGEPVRVTDAEPVTVTASGKMFEGVTTQLTEHSVTVFLDEGREIGLGAPVSVRIRREDREIVLQGAVTAIRESGSGRHRIQTIEILDFGGDDSEYLQVLYDRVPTLPQSLCRDFGVVTHLWQNIAHRVARTGL